MHPTRIQDSQNTELEQDTDVKQSLTPTHRNRNLQNLKGLTQQRFSSFSHEI